MHFPTIQSFMILGSISVASADPFAFLFGAQRGPAVLHTASTGFPTASSGFPAAPTPKAIRKLQVRYDLAPTSAPFVVATPSAEAHHNLHRREVQELHTTGTAGPTGTGVNFRPIPTTFVTARKPIPTSILKVERSKGEGETPASFFSIFKRWLGAEPVDSEHMRRWGSVGEPM